MKFLKDVFIAHAGNSPNSAATASSTSTSAVSGTPALLKPIAILSLKGSLRQPNHACSLTALYSACSAYTMSCNQYLAVGRLVKRIYNTSILSRRPIAAIIPPPNPTTLTPASLSSQLLISLTTQCSLFSSVDSTVQGRRPQGWRPQGLAAVKWNQSNQMTFSTTYLRSLTLRRDLVESWDDLIFYSEHSP